MSIKERPCRAKNPETCWKHGKPAAKSALKQAPTQTVETSIRKLVSIRTIDKVTPIPDADAIEAAHVGGWAVVVRKGQFAEGDKAVYFEIDSLLPETVPLFADFVKNGTRTQQLDNGQTVRGYVVKTVKLRGQVSQGLIFGVEEFPELTEDSTPDEVASVMKNVYGVVKYDPPLPANLSGKVVGYFPTKFVQKTDAERVQNLSDDFLQKVSHLTWVPTEKVDGTSATFIKDNGKLRVCSRNMELYFDPDDPSNTYSQIAKELDLQNVLPEGGVVQGEIYGEGIQKNPLKIRGTKLRVFNTKNVPADSPAGKLIDTLKVPAIPGLTFPKTVDEAVAQADGLKSLLNPQVNTEGIVWWNKEGVSFPETADRACFKAINNRYLLKQRD